MPNGMQQPGAQPSPYIFEDQGNGSGLLRMRAPNGAPGPVIKVIPLPKAKQPMPAPVTPGMPIR